MKHDNRPGSTLMCALLLVGFLPAMLLSGCVVREATGEELSEPFRRGYKDPFCRLYYCGADERHDYYLLNGVTKKIPLCRQTMHPGERFEFCNWKKQVKAYPDYRGKFTCNPPIFLPVNDMTPSERKAMHEKVRLINARRD